MLVVIAAYYVLFAVMGGSMHVLIVESIVMCVFTLTAAVGFTRNGWFVVAGRAALGAGDFLHPSIVTKPRVPEWWAFCLAFDVAFCAPSRLVSSHSQTTRRELGQCLAGPAAIIG